jgi:hypothetical protein
MKGQSPQLLKLGALFCFIVMGIASDSWGYIQPPTIDDSAPAEVVHHIKMLKSPYSKSRMRAADSLRMMGSSKAAIPHLIPLLKDSSSFVRSSAAKTLGEMGESARSAIPHLIPLLRSNEAFDAAYALGAMGQAGEEAVPEIILLLKDSKPQIRRNAVTAPHFFILANQLRLRLLCYFRW